MALRPATDSDWAAFSGLRAPGRWVGLVHQDSPWLIDGFGAVYWGVDGRWWITFARAPGVRKIKTAHKAAKALLALAEAEGMTPIYAMPDDRIGGAEFWLRHLGFEPTDETREGTPVWARK